MRTLSTFFWLAKRLAKHGVKARATNKLKQNSYQSVRLNFPLKLFKKKRNTR